jgi:hypothetical protein
MSIFFCFGFKLDVFRARILDVNMGVVFGILVMIILLRAKKYFMVD